jgi:hypothetical protein
MYYGFSAADGAANGNARLEIAASQVAAFFHMLFRHAPKDGFVRLRTFEHRPGVPAVETQSVRILPVLRGVLHARYGLAASCLQLWTWATAGAFPCQRVTKRDGGNARLLVREADRPAIAASLPKLLACTRRAQG